MAISITQASSKHVASNVGSTTSFSLPGTPAAGSTVLISAITFNSASGGISGVTVGGVPGVRDIRSGTGQSQASIWRVTNFSGASGTVEITHGSASGNYTTAAAIEVADLRATPLDRTATASGSGTANITLSTSTLSNQPQLVFGCFNFTAGNTNHNVAVVGGATSVFIENDSTNNQGGAASYQIVSSTAAPTLEWSRTPSATWEGAIATYQQTEPPPPPTVDRLVGLDTSNAHHSVGLATTSAGAADAGKVPRLNASGVLDSSITGGSSGGGLNKAALLALSAANAFHRNCRTRGLCPTPPTITVGTSTAPSGHTRTYTFGAAGHPFAHSGGNPSTSSGRTTFPVRGANAFAWRVDVVHDGDSVAFLLDSVTADGYRFLVDGQYVSTSSTTSAAGSERYFRLQFSTKARRRITVEGNPGLGFWGTATTDDGQCIRPADAASGNALYVGDSNAFMEGFNQKGDSCALSLTDHLGFRGCWINASSGTGFVVAGSSTNYAGRRADWTTAVADDLFDLIVFQCSYNDRAQTTASVKAAVAAEIAAARDKHPNAVILVHGNNSWNHTGSDVTDLTNTEAAAAEAVTEAADPLIGFIPVYTHPAGTAGLPIQGTSASGDTGTGNTPRYVSHAADHMNPAGNIYFGQWIARRAIEKLAEMGGIDVPALDAPSEPALPAVTPADFWRFAHFGSTTFTGFDIFAGTAISSGINSAAIPSSSLLGYNPGGVLMRSSTTANGGWRYQTSSLVAQIFGGGLSRKFRAQYMPQTDFTGRLVRIGFHDTTTSTDATDGAYFEINGATCSAKTANNSTRETNATTLTLTLGTFYTFDIDVNADGTSARFRVYAGLSTTPVLDVTNTANIPTAQARSFGVGIVATESSTVASDIGILYGMGYGTCEAFARSGMGPI